MYVDIVPNRSSPPAVLLRESWREDGKVHKRTLANISHWSWEKVESLRRVLRASLTVVPNKGMTVMGPIVGRGYRLLRGRAGWMSSCWEPCM